MNPWLTFFLQVEPMGVLALKALINLFKKHPNLNPEQVAQAMTQAATSADAGFDDLIARIEADQAKLATAAPKP